jgi:excisionase family DNA binding protein
MKEISKHFSITHDTVLSRIEKRGMPGVKVGRTWKFKTNEADA